MEATLVLGTSAERRAGSNPVIGMWQDMARSCQWLHVHTPEYLQWPNSSIADTTSRKLNIRLNAFDNSVKII